MYHPSEVLSPRGGGRPVRCNGSTAQPLNRSTGQPPTGAGEALQGDLRDHGSDLPKQTSRVSIRSSCERIESHPSSWTLNVLGLDQLQNKPSLGFGKQTIWKIGNHLVLAQNQFGYFFGPVHSSELGPRLELGQGLGPWMVCEVHISFAPTNCKAPTKQWFQPWLLRCRTFCPSTGQSYI